MHFDDRLDTVLQQLPASEAMARTQFRQILDLLGAMAEGAEPARLDAAFLRLGELERLIPAAERAAIVAHPALRLRSPLLVAQLSQAEPAVAVAAIRAARLDATQWLDLVPALPVRARGLLRHRDDLDGEVAALLQRLGVNDRALPPAEVPAAAPAEMAAETAQARPAGEPIEEIGAIVRRIEAFRRTRQQIDSELYSGETPRLPLGDGYEPPRRPVEGFDFATDTEGRIDWADVAVAPMVVGFTLPGAENAAAEIAIGFRYRQPLRGMRLDLAGAPAIAGAWLMDAVPRFEQPGGHFIGYCGRMRRAPEADPAPAAGESDRMRQILHELRTPVNAIQGFAEVLLYQLYGPTPQEYRALAATIAGDAARILAGFDELDRLVKLDTGALDLERGESDFSAVLAAAVARLDPVMAPRGNAFASAVDDDLRVLIAPAEAERLVWRLLATLAGAADPGEMLKLRARLRDGRIRLSLRLPARLAALDDAALLSAAAPAHEQVVSAGMFGTGFALRLAAAEAQAAGGTLSRRGDRLRLSLPALTDGLAAHSQAG